MFSRLLQQIIGEERREGKSDNSSASQPESHRVSTEYLQQSGSSWVFYSSSDEDFYRIQQAVDNIFSGNYSFYFETEWGIYGYRAPEGYQVLGAWRHPQTIAFAFLLDNSHTNPIDSNHQLLLYITGSDEELSKLRPKCENIKSRFTSISERDRNSSELETRINRIHKSKSLGLITTVLTIFTASINGFALYLRKLPPPELSSDFLKSCFSIMVACVYFSSIFLLLIIIFIVGIFLVKYGFMVIRRM